MNETNNETYLHDTREDIDKCLSCQKAVCDDCLKAPKKRGRASKRRIDLTGQRFGRWTVLGPAPAREGQTAAYFLCRCDCCTESVVIGRNLRNGKTTGCNKCKYSWKREKNEILSEN